MTPDSPPIRVFVADDEAPARQKVRRFLARDPEVEVAGEACDGVEAVDGIARTRPDLLLLDIQMPGLDGFGVLASLDSADLPEIVFITAYDQHALRAFDVHACAYLLKPFDEGRFRDVMSHAKQRVRQARTAERGERTLALQRDLAPRYPPRLLVRERDRARLLPVAELDWVESARNHIVLHARGQTHTVRGTLENIAGKLDPADFTRISRSHIVRLDRIVAMDPWFHGEYRVRLRDGTELMWTRNYLQNLPEML